VGKRRGDALKKSRSHRFQEESELPFQVVILSEAKDLLFPLT